MRRAFLRIGQLEKVKMRCLSVKHIYLQIICLQGESLLISENYSR